MSVIKKSERRRFKKLEQMLRDEVYSNKLIEKRNKKLNKK